MSWKLFIKHFFVIKKQTQIKWRAWLGRAAVLLHEITSETSQPVRFDDPVKINTCRKVASQHYTWYSRAIMAIHASSRQVTVLCGWVNRHHGLDAVFTQIVECCGFLFSFFKNNTAPESLATGLCMWTCKAGWPQEGICFRPLHFCLDVGDSLMWGLLPCSHHLR